MIELRKLRYRTDAQWKTPRFDADGALGSYAAKAGKTAYREEFQPDYGPDPDEPFDVTESGYELILRRG